MEQTLFLDTLGSIPLKETPIQKRVPYYDRLPLEEAADIRLVPRDKQILEAIHTLDGKLTDYQITRLFFQSERRMKDRMGLLYRAHYVNRFSRKQRNSYDFMLYYVDTRGIEYLCETQGKTEKELKPLIKDQQKHLIAHDVRLNDVRIAALQQVGQLPQTRVLDMINSRAFWSKPEKVTYKDFDGIQHTREIKPDWYLHLETPGATGLRELKYFWEYDNNTETNAEIVKEKIVPFLAYRMSDQFVKRFGEGGERYLFVTTTALKVRNMKRAAEELASHGQGVKICYFTTFEEATRPGALFTEPIWYRATIDEPVSLLGKYVSA